MDGYFGCLGLTGRPRSSGDLSSVEVEAATAGLRPSNQLPAGHGSDRGMNVRIVTTGLDYVGIYATKIDVGVGIMVVAGIR